jgi:hypothetical protein
MFSYSAFIGLATLPLISPASGIVMKLIYSQSDAKTWSLAISGDVKICVIRM